MNFFKRLLLVEFVLYFFSCILLELEGMWMNIWWVWWVCEGEVAQADHPFLI